MKRVFLIVIAIQILQSLCSFRMTGTVPVILSEAKDLVEAKDLPSTGIFVEAEAFADKGGWSVDQQFMDLMGSPYLIAHGMGKPVADASTTVDIPEPGVYHVWVRTYNWTSPWTTSKDGPGAFKVKLQGKPVKTVLGTKGDSWFWQYAGSA